MRTLHIHAERLRSLDDIYDQVSGQISTTKRAYFGRNLDALYDVLSDRDFTRIVIHHSRDLKRKLDIQQEDNTYSPYYLLLDLLTDLDHVDIVLQDH